MLSNRGLAVLLIRLFALFLLMRVIADLPQSYFILSYGVPDAAVADDPVRWVTLLSNGLLLVLAVLMWVFVGRLAGAILPQRTAATPEDELTVSGAGAVAFAAVGLLLLGLALPELFAATVRLYQRTQQFAYRGMTLPDYVDMGAAGLQVLIGLLVFLGNRGIVRIVTRLRRAGAH